MDRATLSRQITTTVSENQEIPPDSRTGSRIPEPIGKRKEEGRESHESSLTRFGGIPEIAGVS